MEIAQQNANIFHDLEEAKGWRVGKGCHFRQWLMSRHQ